jgi:chemotaxis response regulator CheB
MGRSFFIVGLGTSAEGQLALIEFLKNIHSNIDVAFIVVTHQWRHHRTKLDRIPSKTCPWPVDIISDRQLIEPRRVYVMLEKC